MLEVEIYSNDKIVKYAPLLEAWMQRDYMHYPYLWIPAEKETSLDIFINEKSTLLTVVKREGHVVGVAAGMRFESAYLSEHFEAPLSELSKEHGIRPETLY